MSTIVLSERRIITAGDDALASEAVHIVQPDRLVIVSCTEEGIGKCLCGRLEAKIPAHDLVEGGREGGRGGGREGGREGGGEGGRERGREGGREGGGRGGGGENYSERSQNLTAL